jgi:hypothetical protein
MGLTPVENGLRGAAAPRRVGLLAFMLVRPSGWHMGAAIGADSVTAMRAGFAAPSVGALLAFDSKQAGRPSVRQWHCRFARKIDRHFLAHDCLICRAIAPLALHNLAQAKIGANVVVVCVVACVGLTSERFNFESHGSHSC